MTPFFPRGSLPARFFLRQAHRLVHKANNFMRRFLLIRVQASSWSFLSGWLFSRLGPSGFCPCSYIIRKSDLPDLAEHKEKVQLVNRILYYKMEPIKLNRKRTHAAITETPPTRRFKDFDDIECGDIYLKWSMCVRVEVKFCPNKYGDNISFILMDKSGAKIEANVCGHAEVERFNRILQPGCKYVIHMVKIRTNMEEVEFRAIGHAYECYFDKHTVVEPSLPIQFPLLPKHLMPFSDVNKRPNKTFVDIVGIVVHCCERERVGTCGNYREAIFMDEWHNLIAVGIWGSPMIQNSYLWSTAEGGNPIVIATMLQKDIEFGDLNTSEHTKFAFNPTHHATRPLRDIRHKISSGAIDTSFVRRFLERRWAFCAFVLARRDARYKKLI